MEDKFFRFPHTPHLAWLGPGVPREDKVLSSIEVEELLASDVVVEEKLDGANLGFSLAPDGSLRAQNRGQYLTEPYFGQFNKLPAWITRHEEALREVLLHDVILFGEWCAARHTLDYAALPDWFLLFDIYDMQARRFWSSERRNKLAHSAKLITVPQVGFGRYTTTTLKNIASDYPSQYRDGPLEGIVIRQESHEWCESRAKLIRPDFTQAMESHWRQRAIEWNRVGF